MLRRDDPAFKKLVDDPLAGLTGKCGSATLLDPHGGRPASAGLGALMKSGEFEALYKKWFQSPIPPRGINLNAPMSQELRDNLKALSDKPVG